MAALAGALPTPEAGYFAASPATFAEWLSEGLGQDYRVRAARVSNAREVAALIAPGGPVERRVIVPHGDWSLLVTDGPHGTDVGMLPSLAARQLGCLGIRAVCLDDGAVFPARMLEVCGPEGEPPLLEVRSIAMSKDGDRWVFETAGRPLPFEDQTAYAAPRKADRFPASLLLSYLSELGVPVDAEPHWPAALLISR